MPPVNRNHPVRAASSESQYSLMEFMREYPDDAACLEALWRRRYSADGVHAECPKCETAREFKRYATKQQRQSWSCVACAAKLHPTAGTIFHKSSTSLHLWFYAMYLMTSTRCGLGDLFRGAGQAEFEAFALTAQSARRCASSSGTPPSNSGNLGLAWRVLRSFTQRRERSSTSRPRRFTCGSMPCT